MSENYNIVWNFIRALTEGKLQQSVHDEWFDVDLEKMTIGDLIRCKKLRILNEPKQTRFEDSVRKTINELIEERRKKDSCNDEKRNRTELKNWGYTQPISPKVIRFNRFIDSLFKILNTPIPPKKPKPHDD